MRILEINKFYNAKRGADKHFLDLIALFKSSGQEVADFSMRRDDDENSPWSKYFLSTVGYSDSFSAWEKTKGIFRMFHSFEARRKINAILDEFKPDIVHVHNLYHQMSPTVLFEIKKRNIPIVMTVHDWKIINPNHSLRLNGRAYRRCAEGKFYQCFLDKCVKNSYAKSFLAMLEAYWHSGLGTYQKNIDLYIAPSNFVKDILTKWGMPKEKIVVLPHFMPEKQGRTSRQFSFSVADSYALYAGKISKEKGVDTLIEIFSQSQGMKLYLAGELEDGFEIPNNSNIVYLGFVANDQLNEYMRNSACIVSGSQLPETFGLIAMEAMNQGRPFIGFDSGAYGEIITNGIDGYVVSTKEEFKIGLKNIIDKKIIFDEQKIKAGIGKYDSKDYAEKLLGIFATLINKKKTVDKV
ncbi:MAG: glycosyltransferase family 4 protein [Candidatus Moranbacteria bacterium]|nr:glycosyltransferase family 4 protein [Candidatus Moranbacteria bacterium]